MFGWYLICFKRAKEVASKKTRELLKTFIIVTAGSFLICLQMNMFESPRRADSKQCPGKDEAQPSIDKKKIISTEEIMFAF